MLSRSCNIDHIVFYDSGPETRMPNCILLHAVFYYREKAQKDLDLDIRKLEDERPMSQQLSDPVTSASTEFVLPKGQIPDGQSFDVCIKSTDSKFHFMINAKQDLIASVKRQKQ
jgi:hypothetical protein